MTDIDPVDCWVSMGDKASLAGHTIKVRETQNKGDMQNRNVTTCLELEAAAKQQIIQILQNVKTTERMELHVHANKMQNT